MKFMAKDYVFTFILLGSVAVGGIAGMFWGPAVAVVKPLGDIFLNLLFMVLVPMVFFGIASSLASMGEMKRFGKIMGCVLLVFCVTGFMAAILGVMVTAWFNPAAGSSYASLQSIFSAGDIAQPVQAPGTVSQIVNAFTVTDFPQLLSKSHILPLIVLAALIGTGTAMAGEQARAMAEFLAAGNLVMMKVVKLIMYYAPIGLGAYFANVVGELGPQILQGYLQSFMAYLLLTVLYYGIFFSLYAYVAGGRGGIRAFWREAMLPSLTALGTCSSVASIPANIVAAEKIGVPRDIVDTVIPLGANIHKDGSVFGGVLKIMFLFGLFGLDNSSLGACLGIVGVSFLVGAVMGGIPGGGMIGEMLILSVYGFPPEALPIIAVISTIIDAPATVLNSVGNVVSSMLVARLVEGKNWLVTSQPKDADVEYVRL